MLNYSVDMDPFIDVLRNMINSIVVKREERAAIYETVDIRTSADKYIAMLEGGDRWESFARFDHDVMLAAGMSQALVALVEQNGKDYIPHEFRSLVCSLQKEKVIDNYVEYNTYYRMLNGEPPIDAVEADFVYMPENDYGIPTDIPIHLLNESYIAYINTSPLRMQLYEANKNKPYLLYLGSRKISYYKARTARNYEIIYVETADNKTIAGDFLKNYGAARNYVMAGLYNKADQRTYEYYDSFMGLVIMVMAIQQTFTTVFKEGISRDFYDDNLIRCLYEAYNIPYIESIDVSYQRIIAKRLNVLLQKKSCNEVLFDIAEVFNYDVNIYKYYLMKDYYKDSEGNPIIIYKTIYDEYGNPHKIVDSEKTYDIYFQKVNIRSRDISAEIADKSNRVEYNAVTGDDSYWIEDSDLISKIHDTKFNSVLTKYMSIDISYELAKLMYETSYGLRMIIDDQEEFKEIRISLPYVVEKVSLYDCVIFLCALVAKKYGLAGSVPLKPYQIAQVYGFNFKTDIEKLKEDIMRDIDSCTGEYKEVRIEILEYLKTLHTSTIAGAREMYDNITALREWMDTAMRYSNSIEEYEAYRKIYWSTLVTRDVEELYTKNDGSYAETFAELLEDRRPDLYAVLEASGNKISTDGTITTDPNVANFSINNKINKILHSLSEISENLRDIQFMNDKEAIVNNIEKVINQMKSYTVDQTASSIKYLIKDPHLCLLKILDYLYMGSSSSSLIDKIQLLYIDVLDCIIPRRGYVENIDIDDELYIKKHILLKDIIHIWDELRSEHKSGILPDFTTIFDAIHGMSKLIMLPNEFIRLIEEYDSNKRLSVEDRIKLIHEIVFKFVHIVENDPILTIDTLFKKIPGMKYLFMLAIEYEICKLVHWDINHMLRFIEVYNEKKLSNVNPSVLIYDALHDTSFTDGKSNIDIKHKLEMDTFSGNFHNLYIKDTLEKIEIESSLV